MVHPLHVMMSQDTCDVYKFMEDVRVLVLRSRLLFIFQQLSSNLHERAWKVLGSQYRLEMTLEKPQKGMACGVDSH